MVIIAQSGWENSGGLDVTDAAFWIDSSAGGTIVVAPVKGGIYAFKTTAVASSFLRKDFGGVGYSPFNCRHYVNFPIDFTTATGTVVLQQFFDTTFGGTVIAGLNRDATGYRWYLTSPTAGTTYSGYITLNLNTWYCFELQAIKGVGTGQATLWIDAVQTLQHLGEAMPNNYEWVWCVGFASTDTNFQVIADNAIIADAYIGPDSNLKRLLTNVGL